MKNLNLNKLFAAAFFFQCTVGYAAVSNNATMGSPTSLFSGMSTEITVNQVSPVGFNAGQLIHERTRQNDTILLTLEKDQPDQVKSGQDVLADEKWTPSRSLASCFSCIF